ncbi:MAG: hypothetical protein WA609_12605, partial [Terriglobales bacterium]
VIDCWLKLYNRINGTTYTVIDWPDKDSSRKAIDAVCQNERGDKIGIEHTLIQPFEGEKTDTARFTETLAGLEGHPELVQPGFIIVVSQPVGVIPKGIGWSRLQDQQRQLLKSLLPTLPEGHHRVPIAEPDCSFDLTIDKRRLGPGDGKLFVQRTYRGDTGPEVIGKALRDKVPKLSAFTCGKKVLLLEQDGVTGNIGDRFTNLPPGSELSALLGKLDEVWSVYTYGLKTEAVIFTGLLWPSVRDFMCSLNLRTGNFLQRAC